ncbi:ribonuclease III [Candidatus Dojkabacteria bacterium]|nr:ribonuclease III [Candidatus Dojkabacteria bacterium]
MEQYSQNIKKIEEVTGHTFKNKRLLLTALTHRSFRAKNPKIFSNERIEFLGDAVLELVISKYIYFKFKDKAEGDLTLIRSALVRTETLTDVINELGLSEVIRMSTAERKSGGEDKPYILANIYESIVGALYIDAGFATAQKFVLKTLTPKLPEILKEKRYKDPKTQLQEITQTKFKTTPTYKLVSELGPAHEREFTVSVCVDQKQLGVGMGNSKQKAEEAAAEQALKKLS